MTTRRLLRRSLAALAFTPLIAMTSAPGVSALEPPTINDPAVVLDESGDLFASPCPEMTDSVYRLYSAFFGREPDETGWQYWMQIYVQPTTNLESIANDFVMSSEFQAMYGTLSNADFVRLVYNNVMGREPDQVGLDHWVGSLDAGYSRGAVMIAFSESAEYVALTGTWPPLAGYLQWYGRPLQFACGNGPVVVTNEMQSGFADVLIWNDASETVGYRLGVDTPSGPFMDDHYQLAPASYSIYWNLEIGLVDGRAMIVEVPDRTDVFWTVVFYGHPHAPDRSPFTDGFGAFTRTADSVEGTGTLLGALGAANTIGFADWQR